MTTTPLIQIAPSILDADLGHLADEVDVLEKAGADWLHLDIMDGHFVPNLSIGVPVVASLRRHTNLFLDAHLMISEPGKYAESFVKAGADGITFHIEVTDDPKSLVREIRDLGVKVGVSLNPGTPASSLDPIIEDVDLVLVMTVWPGFGGQTFIEDCLEKMSAIAARLRPDQVLQVDGGINTTTARLAGAAGATMFVAGKAIVAAPDKAKAISEIRAAATAGRDSR